VHFTGPYQYDDNTQKLTIQFANTNLDNEVDLRNLVTYDEQVLDVIFIEAQYERKFQAENSLIKIECSGEKLPKLIY
jgi:hypothetical protein